MALGPGDQGHWRVHSEMPLQAVTNTPRLICLEFTTCYETAVGAMSHAQEIA
jgi:hypothetical protein